jgi:hypothetical protein
VASPGCIASLGLMGHSCLCLDGKQKEQVRAKSKKIDQEHKAWRKEALVVKKAK